ncbi:MAG TPA: hypothetical protein GXZ98_02015 [Firmicutes bacterium]|jgi:hypothetical protein|nr:hypothetical protein [Bacillota bacterium]
MVRASAKKLTPESPAPVRTKKVKKVVINLEKVRWFLRIGGLLVVLTMANASIQALVAQTQYQLADLQAELKTVDHQIGWLQWELASRVAPQQLARQALKGKTRGDVERTDDALSQLTPNLVLPPSILIVDPATTPTGNKVTAKLHDLLAGVGRTMAKGALSE